MAHLPCFYEQFSVFIIHKHTSPPQQYHRFLKLAKINKRNPHSYKTDTLRISHIVYTPCRIVIGFKYLQILHTCVYDVYNVDITISLCALRAINYLTTPFSIWTIHFKCLSIYLNYACAHVAARDEPKRCNFFKSSMPSSHNLHIIFTDARHNTQHFDFWVRYDKTIQYYYYLTKNRTPTRSY